MSTNLCSLALIQIARLSTVKRMKLKIWIEAHMTRGRIKCINLTWKGMRATSGRGWELAMVRQVERWVVIIGPDGGAHNGHHPQEVFHGSQEKEKTKINRLFICKDQVDGEILSTKLQWID